MNVTCFSIVSLFLVSASAFTLRPQVATSTGNSRLHARIEYQSDCGRGEQHLSASVMEGDMVVYQGGTWLVDGVEVGEGSEPYFRYALVETMQIVWTHNCEHGVLRGLRVECFERVVTVLEPMDEVEFGPEQLIAKIPVTWDETGCSGLLQAYVTGDMWVPME